MSEGRSHGAVRLVVERTEKTRSNSQKLFTLTKELRYKKVFETV